MMKKAVKFILLTVLILALTLTLFSCRTSAYWQEQSDETQKQNANTQKANGSEKYVVYAALNASGNLITRPAQGEPEATAAYAVVGYTGLVAELVIPATYNGLNVTKVLVATPYSDYYCFRDGAAYTGDDARLANQTVVTKLTFGSNVTFVGAGVCAGMVNLTEVAFTSSGAVSLGDRAFSACTSLRTVSGSWQPAAGATPFFASGYTPAP